MRRGERYGGSGLNDMSMTLEQQSWEGRRGQQHGAGSATARSGSGGQHSTGMSHRYGVERDGSCSSSRGLTTAASGKGQHELPVGQKLQQAWGKAAQLHRERGATQGVKQSTPGAGGSGGCGVTGREQAWASTHCRSMETGPARCPQIYLAEKSKAGCPGV